MDQESIRRVSTPSEVHFRTDLGSHQRLMPSLIAGLYYSSSQALSPGRVLADLGMGCCLVRQGACALNDQHRQTQSIQRTQGVLEIDALAVLELDSMPTETPQCLAAWSMGILFPARVARMRSPSW
jgi:hypothetical protein